MIERLVSFLSICCRCSRPGEACFSGSGKMGTREPLALLLQCGQASRQAGRGKIEDILCVEER